MKQFACLASIALAVLAVASVVILLTVPQGAATALPLGANGTWVNYTISDGLPSNSVWGGVAVDNAGRVWAGFENGGYDYPLPSNTLIAQLEGTAWITYPLTGCRASPLVAEEELYTGSYCPGPGGGAGAGLSWFNNGTWVNFSDTLGGGWVRGLAPEGDHKVWVSLGDRFGSPDVYLLDHKGTTSKTDDEWKKYTLNSGLGFSSVDVIALDPSGNRWFGTNVDILRLSSDGTQWITYTGSQLNHIDDIAFDTMGNAWFARGQQVARLNGTAWTYYNTREAAIEANFNAVMTSYKRNHVNPFYLPGLWAVEPDAGVWIIKWQNTGYSNGVGFYNGQAWVTYTMANSTLGSDIDIRGIAVDQQGNILIGTNYIYAAGNGGLSKFTPSPAFSLSATSPRHFVGLNDTLSMSVTVSHLRGWTPAITLTVGGVPNAAIADFVPEQITLTAYSTLVITTTADTPLGEYPLSIEATDGSISNTSFFTLIVVSKVYSYYWPIIFH
jgi:hypothetical protein